MPLSREEAFELWAPHGAPWSAWTKPVLFAHFPAVIDPSFGSEPPRRVAVWERPVTGNELLVVDLPGTLSLALAERLVAAGIRPVPLFNAIPARPEQLIAGSGYQPRELVDIDPIVEALANATLRLRHALASLPAEAPPAFLLDSRRSLGVPPRPGDFDNRSLSLPTDFPSAELLQSRGITSVLLVLEEDDSKALGGQPRSDLSHTLLRWQEAGLTILGCQIDDSGCVFPGEVVHVRRPPWFRALWYGVLATFGLKRNPMGGFGGKLPLPSSG